MIGNKAHVDVMPAPGTHMPMSDEEMQKFFGDVIPRDRIIVHHWQTVTTSENDAVNLHGLYIWQSRKPFEHACELSQKLNIVHVERRAAKVVAYLEPTELKTTWVGNKGVYRTRMMSAAHLIQRPTDGRFTITYATRPDLMSREEIEGAGYQWADYNEISKRYDPEKLKDGWNVLPDGEEIYYVSTPALGLWKVDD